jgi:hypothetical protein
MPRPGGNIKGVPELLGDVKQWWGEHLARIFAIGRHSRAQLHDRQKVLDALPSATPASAEPQRQIPAAIGTEDAGPIPIATNSAAGSEGHNWGQLGGEVLQSMAGDSVTMGEPSTIRSDEAEKAQALALSTNENRRQPLAAAGEKRHRWESDPRWRICNPHWYHATHTSCVQGRPSRVHKSGARASSNCSRTKN